MATSRADFHAGKAAAAFAASQQQHAASDGAGRVDTRVSVTDNKAAGWFACAHQETLQCVEWSGQNLKELRPPQESPDSSFIVWGRDRQTTQEPNVLANGSSQGSVGSFASPPTDTYEAARRQRAARLGCAYVPPTMPTPAYILICAELARLAVALHFALAFRVWLVLYQLARENNANGFTRTQIEAALRRYNIKFSTRNLTRWLRLGVADGLFWHYDTVTRLYYPRGYASLSESLVTCAIEKGELDWIDTNYPGQRKPVHLNVASDSLLQFESNCFAAWIGSRENLTISRQSQATLWGRDESVLRQWGRINPNIETTANYAFCDEDDYDAIPRQADGTWRPDVHRTTLNGRDVIAWQLPNTYHSKIRQHAHKGQLRYVFSLMKVYIQAVQAAGDCEQGDGHSASPGGSNPTAKMYFSSNKSAKENCNRHGESRRYVFKGRWGMRYGYYEFTRDGKPKFDFWQCRKVFRRQQCVCFAKRQGKIVVLKVVDKHPF